MKRTFIALPIPPADERFIAFLQYIRRELKTSGISWVDPSILHLTLFFMGDTDPGKIPVIHEGLTKIAKRHKNFFYACTGAGYFGSSRDPRVIWAGTEEHPILIQLQKEVAECLVSFGWKEEERAWHPHITLGRIKYISKDAELRNIIAPFQDQELQINEAREIIFYESLLAHSGPIYKPIARIPLVG